MVVSVETLAAMTEFADLSEETLLRMTNAAELLIRAYTHNNFQNRGVRFEGYSDGTASIFGDISPYLQVGDTVEISQSVNNGLYTVTEIGDGYITLGSTLFAVDYNLVTKVQYPDDIVSGVINLLLWDVENRQKVGIKSETLSRHSVTYYDQDVNNTVMGYPVALMAFLKPYMKARF